jgi:hypothetical protein
VSKGTTLLLISLLTALSLIMVHSVFAESIPKPSLPEFTVRFVNASYTVTTTNAYTGLDETEQISNNSIEITITNQPFDYSDYQLYYNIRVKPRFAGNWTEVYPLQNRTSSYNTDSTFSYAEYVSPDSPTQSKSSYIIIYFPVVPTELYGESGYDVQRYYSGYEGEEGRYFAFLSAIPDGAQLDFQVEALVGHDSQRWVIDHPLYPWLGGHFTSAIAYDGTSGWSNTQSITIGESQTLTPFPTNHTGVGLTEIIVGVAIIAAVISTGLGLLIYLIKRK